MGKDLEPPLEHEGYERVNATLHARFALATWRLALERGMAVEGYAKVLAKSHITRVSMSFRRSLTVSEAVLIEIVSVSALF